VNRPRYDEVVAAEREVLDFDDVARLVVLLGDAVAPEEHDLMLVITRGGLIPGGILAYQLGIKNILVAAVEFYDDAGGRREAPTFLQFPADPLLRGQRVLVVDEVWDSGRTIEAVVARIRQAGGTPTTAVLHFKPGRDETGLRPDHHVVETNAWVVYPWTRVAEYLAVRPAP
jgi:hypoxanthine phosphoribosyltransferase